MDSIVQVGLLHPIVVKSGNTLVSGERRARAVSNLAGLAQPYSFGGVEWSPEFIPAIDIGEADELLAEEAEFDENTKRANLTWQERASATARLVALRRKKAERDGKPAPTIAEIAVEVRGSDEGSSHEATRREIIVFEHFDDPDVAKAKNLDEAFKVLKRKEETKRHADLALSVGVTFGKHVHVLHNADSYNWLRECPAEQFDVICTDPPYGMGADTFGNAGGRVNVSHAYDDSEAIWEELIGTCGAHWFRVAKSQAHLYVCCDIDGFHYAREWLAKVGWWVHRTPIINFKKDGSRVPWPQHGPQRKWEMILYAVKGQKPVTRIYPDVIETLGDENLGHGAQKPVSLFVDLLKRSVRPGDKVLDTFAGTGSVVVAGHELQCAVTAIEKNPASYGIMVERINKL